VKRRFLLVLTLLFIVSLGFVAYLKRYQLAAKLWHWRYGYRTTVGNYEVPVSEHWLIFDRYNGTLTLMNTAFRLPRDGKFHAPATITVSPLHGAFGMDRLNFWLSLRRQWFEQEQIKSLEEKQLSIGDAATICIGGSELRDVIVGHGHREFDSDLISLECRSTDNLDILFVGEPSDVQSFYSFVAQIRRTPATAN